MTTYSFLRGIILTASFMLFICLVGLGTLKYRAKTKAAEASKAALAREAASADAASKRNADKIRADGSRKIRAWLLAQIAALAEDMTTVEQCIRTRREIAEWIAAGDHPLKVFAASFGDTLDAALFRARQHTVNDSDDFAEVRGSAAKLAARARAR